VVKAIPDTKPIEGIKKMKYAAVRVLAAGLLLSGASLIPAQSPEPPHFLRIFREDIKSGKSSAHEKVESAYVRAFSKAGYPSYLALDGKTGTSQAWFLESYDSYESLEKAMHMAEAEPLKTTLSGLDAQDGELRTGERNMIATYQKDLSYLPVPSNLIKARFVNINMVRVRPGHAADFAEMRKLVNAAFEKSESQQRRVVYSVSSGMPAGTYLIIAAMDSLKAMDTPAGAMSMAEAFGADNLAKYNKLQADIVISSEFTLFAVNPKMSNPPKEFIAADPGFWAPKPPAAKPAAKPAGTQ
jgi:hypothetical protein